MTIDISALPAAPGGVVPTDSIMVLRVGAPTPYKAPVLTAAAAPMASGATPGLMTGDGTTLTVVNGVGSVVGTAAVAFVGALVPATDAFVVQRGTGAAAITGPASAAQVSAMIGQTAAPMASGTTPGLMTGDGTTLTVVNGVGSVVGQTIAQMPTLTAPTGTPYVVLFQADGTPSKMTLAAYQAMPGWSAPALVLTMPTGVQGGSGYTITGVFFNDGTNPILTMSVDGGAFGALPAMSTATGGVINLVMPGIATGTHTVQVKDGNALLSNTVSFIAAAPETLTITTPATQMVGILFTVAGTYANGVPTALDWSLDGTTWTSAVSPTISAGTYSIVGLVATTPNGTQNVRVRDHAAQSIVAISAAFAVVAAETITVTTPATQVAGTAFAIAGTYTNGPPAALDWSVDGTTWTASTGAAPATGAYSIPGVMVATANASQTVRVRDRALPTIIGTSVAFTVTPSVATAATLATVPTTGTVNVAITGATATLTPTSAMAYACLYTAAADVGTRIAFTGTAVPALTPASAASYTMRLYAAATGGTALAESAAIAVAVAPVGPANTVTINSYNGAAFRTDTPTTLVASGGTSSGRVSVNNYVALVNTTGGTSVPTTTPNVYGSWHTSPVSPPTVAGTLVPTTTFNANGYTLLAAFDTANFALANIGAAGATGFAPSPGTPYYLWISIDNRATWSVARDAGNVATMIRVIG